MNRTMLVHRDLPKLAREGFVTWDREGGRVSKGPNFGDVEPLLVALEEHGDERRADSRWLDDDSPARR